MKNLSLLLLLFLISINSFALITYHDRIIYEGDTLSLQNRPLKLYPKFGFTAPSNLFGSKSGCWDAYSAIWEIIDEKLFLTEIKKSLLYQQKGDD